MLEKIIPNVLDKPDALLESIQETLVMTVWSGAFIFILGLFFGVILTVTKPGGICENKPLFQVLDKCINFFRSIPFIILLASLMPFEPIDHGNGDWSDGSDRPSHIWSHTFFYKAD